MGKKILNVFGVLVSIVLSLVLLVMLIITPVISGVTKLSQKETLHSVVENIDLTGFMELEEGNPAAALVETEFFSGLLDLYLNDLMAELDGQPQTNMSAEALDQLKETHEEELLAVMRAMLEDTAEENELEGMLPDGILTDEMVLEALDEFYDEIAPTLVEELPTLEELGLSQEVLDGINQLRSKKIQTAAIVMIAVLSLLILGCRWPRFKGFMWLAVVNILVCPVMLVARSGLGIMTEMFLSEDLQGLNGVLEPILAVFRGSMMTYAVVYGILAVLCVLVFVLGRKMGKKNTELPAVQG